MLLLYLIGRVAYPEEVAAIVNLLSEEASFVNGTTVPIDGGWSVLASDPQGAECRGAGSRTMDHRRVFESRIEERPTRQRWPGYSRGHGDGVSWVGGSRA
jgi:hypothetical protein